MILKQNDFFNSRLRVPFHQNAKIFKYEMLMKILPTRVMINKVHDSI